MKHSFTERHDYLRVQFKTEEGIGFTAGFNRNGVNVRSSLTMAPDMTRKEAEAVMEKLADPLFLAIEKKLEGLSKTGTLSDAMKAFHAIVEQATSATDLLKAL